MNLKVKVTGAWRLQAIKTEGKLGKEGKLKRPPHHGDTGIIGVVTRRLTGGKISSPSQP